MTNIDSDIKTIGNKIDQLRQFRNRIFHYEPICYSQNLATIHRELMDVIGWIEPQLRELNEVFDEFNDRKTLKKQISKKLSKYHKKKKMSATYNLS